MGPRLGVNLRAFRAGRDELADAWVAGVLPLLPPATVCLAGRSQAQRLAELAPGLEVRAVEETEPVLSRAALAGVDVLACPLGPLDPPEPGVPSLAAPGPELTGRPTRFLCATESERERHAIAPLDAVVIGAGPRPELQAEGDEAAFAALGLPDDYVLAEAHPDHAALVDELRDNGAAPLVFLSPGLAGAHELRVRAEELGVGARVRLVGTPPARAMPLVLRRAQAVAHRVRDERFPLLVVDALAAAVPVLPAPDTPAAEVAAKGAAAFTWERTSEDLLEAARAVAREGVAVRFEPPTVSVVTPNLNMARFLRETVESVLGQDYPRLEYLVLDGGSTDGSVELLRSYGDRLRYVSGPDGGQADAVNRGLAMTGGSVFAFLNADDTYRPGAVARAVEGFRERPDAGVVYGDGVHVDEDGNELAPYPTRDFDPAALGRRCFICQPAAFMSRAALEKAGGLDPRLHVALDYDLWIRLAKRHAFARVEGVLATSRMHSANKTLAARRVAHREGAELLKRHFGYVPLDWLHTEAQHLLEGVDQFFVHSRPTARSRALALALAVRHNPGRLGRVWREWATDAGLRSYDGRWEDGWISRRYVDEVDVPADCDRIRVAGRHEAWMQTPLEVSLHLDGEFVASRTPRERGAFEIAADCPPGVRGRRARLEIAASKTWRPRARGDRRQLSCVIDSIELS